MYEIVMTKQAVRDARKYFFLRRVRRIYQSPGIVLELLIIAFLAKKDKNVLKRLLKDSIKQQLCYAEKFLYFCQKVCY